MNMDWKFVVTTLVAIAGIAVSVWLWRADVGGSSLSVQVSPAIALQPKGLSTVQDIKITVAGKEVESPYLTVISLINDGSKPIPTSAYESPIQFAIGEGSKVVRSSIDTVTPKDLKVSIVSKDQVISIAPLLLNPGDAISLSVITSGGKPDFKVGARIAGISEISMNVGEGRQAAYIGIFVLVMVAVFSYMVSLTFIDSVTGSAKITVSRGVAAFFALAAGLLGSGSISEISERLAAVGSSIGYWAAFASIFVVAIVLNLMFVRVRKIDKSKSVAS